MLVSPDGFTWVTELSVMFPEILLWPVAIRLTELVIVGHSSSKIAALFRARHQPGILESAPGEGWKCLRVVGG